MRSQTNDLKLVTTKKIKTASEKPNKRRQSGNNKRGNNRNEGKRCDMSKRRHYILVNSLKSRSKNIPMIREKD